MLRPACAFALSAVLIAAMPQAQEPIKPGPWQKNQVPDGWLLHETTHYQIQSQCGIDKARRLANHMEAMNRVYRSMFKPEKDGAKPYAIKLFKDHEGFLTYGRVPGAAAYYSPTAREMVCYDSGTWSDEVETAVTPNPPAAGDDAEAEAMAAKVEKFNKSMDLDLLGAAAHEGWHQYFHWYVTSWVELPSWINEGMGDYFYTAVPKKVAGKKVPAELGRVFPMRLWIIKMAVERNRFVPVADILKFTQRQYYSNPQVCYAEGWALCQFMLHSGNPKYAKIVPIYIRTVRDDTNMDAVTKKAFKDIDLEQLEKDFVDWVKKQTLT